MTTVVRSRPSRLLAALLGLLAAAALALGAAAGPAAAHEGDAVVVIESIHPAGQSIHYIVRVTWENDGHPAADATVTATAVAPDGTQLTPVALAPADADGRYAGAIEYPAPGAWTVRVTSIDPTGTVEQPQEVTATVPTAGPDVTTGSGDAGGFAPEEDGTGASDPAGSDDGQQAATDTGDDGRMPVAVIAVAAAVVVIGAVTALGIVRRVRANPPAGSGTGASGTGANGAGSRGGTAGAGEASAGAAAGDPPGGDEPAASGTDPGRG